MTYWTPVRTIALLGAIGALLIANGLQYLDGLHPCTLCGWERIPYWALLVAALYRRVPPWPFWLLWMGAVGLAGLHTGVEQHWWPDPVAACSLGALTTGPVVLCNQPTWIGPWPLSLAASNLLYALLGLLGTIFTTLRHARPSLHVSR